MISQDKLVAISEVKHSINIEFVFASANRVTCELIRPKKPRASTISYDCFSIIEMKCSPVETCLEALVNDPDGYPQDTYAYIDSE